MIESFVQESVYYMDRETSREYSVQVFKAENPSEDFSSLGVGGGHDNIKHKGNTKLSSL